MSNQSDHPGRLTAFCRGAGVVASTAGTTDGSPVRGRGARKAAPTALGPFDGVSTPWPTSGITHTTGTDRARSPGSSLKRWPTPPTSCPGISSGKKGRRRAYRPERSATLFGRSRHPLLGGRRPSPRSMQAPPGEELLGTRASRATPPVAFRGRSAGHARAPSRPAGEKAKPRALPNSSFGRGGRAADARPRPAPAKAEAAKPEKTAASVDPKMRPMPVRKLRAIAGKGAQVVGQDGITVKFRKVCTVCKHQDWYNGTAMRIVTGLTQRALLPPEVPEEQQRRRSSAHLAVKASTVRTSRLLLLNEERPDQQKDEVVAERRLGAFDVMTVELQGPGHDPHYRGAIQTSGSPAISMATRTPRT